MTKKFISLILATLMAFGMILIATINVSAITQSEFDSKLNALRAQYPNYSVWTESFEGGIECFGFARMIGYNVFGSSPSSWSKIYSINNVKKGDILQYGNTTGGGHTVFVTNVSGNTITFVDCNGNGNYSGSTYVRYCGVKWDNTLNKYSKMFNRYSFSYLLSSPDFDSADNPTEHLDLGTDFYASITHFASWNHLTVEDNDNVDICWETYRDNQYWKFYRQYDGSYKIVSAKNGKCLDVTNKSSNDGANIGVYTDNNSEGQRWYIYKCGNGYQLKPKCSNCVMEMNAWNFYQGVNLVCGTKDNSDAEIFAINKRNFDDIASTELNYNDNNGVINFSWNIPKGASKYNIKIYNGKNVWNSDAPINLWNIQGNSFSIDLGEGTYTALLQTYNALSDYHECRPITFTTNVTNYKADGRTVYKGHIYELYDKPTSWETAKIVCENKGGHLATITSEKEQKTIEKLVQHGNAKYYNIGATNKDDITQWKWVTGEAMAYTNWAVGEPNNVSNLERYLSIFTSDNYFGKWNDTTNFSTAGVSNGFICEYDYMIGDVNFDGSIDIVDATEIQKHIVNINALSDEQLAVADVNGDGNINVIDATQIQKYIANLISELG